MYGSVDAWNPAWAIDRQQLVRWEAVPENHGGLKNPHGGLKNPHADPSVGPNAGPNAPDNSPDNGPALRQCQVLRLIWVKFSLIQTTNYGCIVASWSLFLSCPCSIHLLHFNPFHSTSLVKPCQPFVFPHLFQFEYSSNLLSNDNCTPLLPRNLRNIHWFQQIRSDGVARWLDSYCFCIWPAPGFFFLFSNSSRTPLDAINQFSFTFSLVQTSFPTS